MEGLVYAALGVGVVGLILAAVALWQLRIANRRLAEVTPDTPGLAGRVRDKDPEQAFQAIFTQIEGVSRRMGKLEGEMEELTRVVSRAIRRVGLARFDANEEIRGELSFALCMLDNRDNGLILSSLYTFDDCRVFIRGVVGGKTRHDLMPEEAQALEQALGEP
jgi:hypothetical protein